MVSSEDGAADRSRRLRRLLNDTQQRMELGCDELISQLRRALPSYEKLPVDEQRRSVLELNKLMLESLEGGGEPTVATRNLVRAGARRRAHYRVDPYDLLAAIHIASRAVWAQLRESPYAADDLLIEVVDPLANWCQMMSDVVVDSYADRSSLAHDGRVEAARETLFSGLGDDARLVQMSEAARILAFKPSGEFQALCSLRDTWDAEKISELRRRLQTLQGIAHCGVHGSLMIVLGQETDEGDLTREVRRVAAVEVQIGVGLQRSGLTGAGFSVNDAERALGVARLSSQDSVRFQNAWLEASLLDSRSRLAPLFLHAQRIARDYPDLAKAVLTYASSGFSLSSASKTLVIHPNSVSYRLGRWRELTNLDPRDFSELIISVVAMTLYPESVPADLMLRENDL